MKIGRYEILDEIGRGAMGTVYRARDPLIERTVAIKAVEIDQLQQEGNDAEARFLREAQSAGRLSHPNIVTIYDVGEAEGLAYIAMEYLSGAPLRTLMNKGPMPIELVLDTAAQMAEALAFAHEHGVIHRDVKPANVIVTGRLGRVKLTDFGIAHLANAGQTHTGQMLGSPRYMSPEQAMGREVDGRTDIFSLGAVLYEMLTGRYAFDGDSLPTILYRVVNEAPTPIASLRPGVPEALIGLVGRMMSKNPDGRPDARALASAFHALLPGAAPLARPLNARVPAPLRALAFTAPVGVLLLIGVGIIVIEHFLQRPAAQVVATLPSPSPSAPVVPAVPVQQAAPPPATAPAPPPSAARPAPAQDAYLAGIDRKRVELRLRRTELLLKYTAEHPDVVQIDRQLERLQQERRRYLRQLEKNEKA